MRAVLDPKAGLFERCPLQNYVPRRPVAPADDGVTLIVVLTFDKRAEDVGFRLERVLLTVHKPILAVLRAFRCSTSSRV